MTRPSRTALAAARRSAVLMLFALGAACSGGTASTAEGAAESEGQETPVDSAYLTAEAGGPSHFRLAGADQLASGSLVELVPRGPWPLADSTRPARLVGLVASVDGDTANAVVLGQRGSATAFDTLQARPIDRAGMTSSKSLTTVLSVQDREVRLDVRASAGVSPGDFFFILGEPDQEPERLGSRIIALLQIREVSTSGSQGRVIHQMADFEPGAIAIFAHHATLDSERPEALILFARTRREGEADPFALPPLAEAVFDYQAQFQFSNIRIETLDAFIDPSAYDAPEQAQELAPDEGFGVLVFGEERADDFLYNITTYGSSPSLATSVGILPGGLPLPTPEGIEGLSSSLAPSFLATAMTQRGDHAETIYFLEYCLRTQDIEGPVAFHLREHLALRYESIGRPIEGLWLMDHDIAVAQETDNTYAELNALSIREYLHRSLYDYEAELADLDAFLEVADDVLPDESLLSERLEKSRVLGRLDRNDEAIELLDDVIRDAQGQQRLRWEVSGAIARANLLFSRGDRDQAVTELTSVLPNARVLGESYPRYVHALLAQFLADQDETEEALLNLQAALAYASTDASPFALASTHEMAATLYYSFDNLVDSVTNMREAARIYSEIPLFEDAARALIQVGMLELNAAVSAGDPNLLENAYDHLAKSADTYLAIGDSASAAQALGAMAMINALLRQGAQATANYGRTIELGIANNDPETVAIAWERLAELYLAVEQIEQAQRALQSARLWAETFELTGVLEEIESLEQSMQNAI